MTSQSTIEQEIAYHIKNNDPESAKAAFDQWLMKKRMHPTEEEISEAALRELATLF